MAAGGQEHKVEGPENFDMDGLDIDADFGHAGSSLQATEHGSY